MNEFKCASGDGYSLVVRDIPGKLGGSVTIQITGHTSGLTLHLKHDDAVKVAGAILKISHEHQRVKGLEDD